MDPVLTAGMAHLWFVSVHPFEDGNGRIARAIADIALARSEKSPERFFSMSAQIRLERNAYYDNPDPSDGPSPPTTSSPPSSASVSGLSRTYATNFRFR